MSSYIRFLYIVVLRDKVKLNRQEVRYWLKYPEFINWRNWGDIALRSITTDD